MSLISSRLSLTHRCTVERNVNVGSDDGWGNPLPPDWETHLEDQPCRAWVSGERTAVHEGTLTSVLIELKMIVALGTDVTDGDRINTISYRGEPIHGGPLAIYAVLPRRDHLELVLSKAA